MRMGCQLAGAFRWMVALLLGLPIAAAIEMPKVIFVPIDEATLAIIDVDTPTALEYATFLKFVQTHSPRSVGVVDLMHWAEVEPTAINGLITQAKPLDIVYAAMLDDDAKDPNVADALRPFPQEFKASGDLSGLASFESVSRIPKADLLVDKAVGFTLIDFGADMRIVDKGVEVPLLARGPNSELAISLPLLIAGKALGLSWKDVSIGVGTQLELGSDTQPIPLDLSGQLLLPLEAPTSLQRLSGEQLIGAEDPLKQVRDAVLILGSDLERDRIFALANGQRASRAEMVAWAVSHLLELATASPPPTPEPDPVVEVAQVVPAEREPASPAPLQVYHFPDLRAPNVGLWVLGVGLGLTFGCLLLQSRPKKAKVKPPPRTLTQSPISEEGKSEPESAPSGSAKARVEPEIEAVALPKKGKKLKARNRRTRSQRRRPS